MTGHVRLPKELADPLGAKRRADPARSARSRWDLPMSERFLHSHPTESGLATQMFSRGIVYDVVNMTHYSYL